MGACLGQLRYASQILVREANAVTDNPLVFSADAEPLSGGNFHAEPAALVCDALAVAVAEVGAIAERRIAMLILWAGIGEAQKLSVIFIGSFFQLVLMIAVIVGNTRRDLVEAAYTLGSSDASLIKRVLLPGAAPEIAETLRMVLGWAWTYVIVAELIGASSGIGHMITDSQALLATDQIIFGIIVIGLIGLVSDYLFKGANRIWFPWAQLGR